MIVVPALSAAGMEVKLLTMSRSTMIEARKESCELMVASVRQNFQPMVPLIAHFDGIFLPNQDGMKRDRMAIFESGLNIEKLFGIPVISYGSGQMMGQNVMEFLHVGTGVEENLAGLCFDITASNTGVHTGAITVVQELFKPLTVPCMPASPAGDIRRCSIRQLL